MRNVLILAAAAFVIAAIASLALLFIGGNGAEAGTGTTHIVFVNNSVFCGEAVFRCPQPYSIQIAPGDTVQWTDGRVGELHTVTQCTGDGSGCPAPGGFDSGILSDPPSGYLTQPFPTEGTFFYRCQVHGNGMRGIITVSGPSTPTASPSPSPTSPPTPTPATGPVGGTVELPAGVSDAPDAQPRSRSHELEASALALAMAAVAGASWQRYRRRVG